MRFKIDWASLIVGRKFTCFASFYFVSEGTVSKYKPSGGFYFEGRFNGGFYALRVWGGGGACIWRGLFLEFYGISHFKRTEKYSPGKGAFVF